MAIEIEPPGQRIEVGERSIHVVDSGSGIPVVFEAGAGEWSSHWELVTGALGDGWRTVAYDRAGLGWSEPAAGSRSADVLAGELVDLLEALGIDRPVILVAHSFGASIARCFVRRDPDRLLGMIFVDGWHESFEDWEREQASQIRDPWWQRLLGWLDGIGALRGLGRLLERISPSECPWPLPEQTWKAMLSISLSKAFAEAAQLEVASFEESNAEAAAAERIEVPIVVLVAKETLNREQMPANYPIEAHNSAWLEASSRLASLSDSAEIRALSDTDHMVQLVRPEAVVEAIRAVAEKAGEFESGAP